MALKKGPEGPDTIFFFGAGASIKANVPDTYGFLDEFIEHIQKIRNVEKSKCLDEIITILRERNSQIKESEKVDVEELLASLDGLSNRTKEYLSSFYYNSGFRLKTDAETISSLAEDLKNFIRSRVIVKEDVVQYLEDLLRFEFPLIIFSVNYDTCIEQLCHTHKIRYSDGFSLFWDPDDFTKEGVQVRHYKIHGSAIFYETDKKEYIKIPLEFQKGRKLESYTLITGEKTTPLITYPLQKWDYVEPLTEMQLMFKEHLLRTKFVVVVGYSFRDEYIKRMLWDSANKNDDLIFIFIDPQSPGIYEDKLAYYDKGIASSLRNKILLLPYPFENILPLLKNKYISILKEGRKQEIKCLAAEKEWGIAFWSECIKNYIECGFTSRYEEILNSFGWDNVSFNDWKFGPRNFVLAFQALLDSVCVENKMEQTWLRRLNQAFENFSVNNIEINPSSTGFYVFFKTKWKSGDKVGLNEISRDLLDPILKRFYEKRWLLGKKLSDKIDVLEASIKKLEFFKANTDVYGHHITFTKFLEICDSSIATSDHELANVVRSGLDVLNRDNKQEEEALRKIKEKLIKDFSEVFENQSFRFSLEK